MNEAEEEEGGGGGGRGSEKDEKNEGYCDGFVLGRQPDASFLPSFLSCLINEIMIIFVYEFTKQAASGTKETEKK